MKIKDKLETQEFYELMQYYRHLNYSNQKEVIIAFENVKEFIKKPYKKIYD
jgi:hypothetical protein